MLLTNLIKQVESFELPTEFQFHVFESCNAEALYKVIFERDHIIGAGEAMWFRDGMKMGSTKPTLDKAILVMDGKI